MGAWRRKHQKDAGIGAIVTLMLPYTITLLIIWTLPPVLWYQLGILLGPS